MPRKQFVADLQQLSVSTLPPGIGEIRSGEDDGQVQFTFTTPREEDLNITAFITDLSDYPTSHQYIFFGDERTSSEVARCLDDMRGTRGSSLHAMLEVVSQALSKLGSQEFAQEPDSDPDTMIDCDEDEHDIYDSDQEMFNGQSQTSIGDLTVSKPFTKASTVAFRDRIRHDLRVAKDAGFKISQFGHLLAASNAFVSISIRISRLGISDEVMEAWRIVPDDYLILIIYYRECYATYEQLQLDTSSGRSPAISFRVCVSKRYKPTLHEVTTAFDNTLSSNQNPTSKPSDIPQGCEPMRPTFISRPLISLLEESLIDILKLRGIGLGWSAAESWCSQIRDDTSRGTHNAIPDEYFDHKPENTNFTDLVAADHCRTAKRGQCSFPLVAMQYVLRRFVRCTEFCLVCHRRLETDIEAIKPYVCERGLCLYQYMTLGFGPSIEHEIRSEPNVVDLLISFCYSAAHHSALEHFPDGLALMVPPSSPYVKSNSFDQPYAWRRQTPPAESHKSQEQIVGIDFEALEMLFFDPPSSCPVRKGQWMVLNSVKEDDRGREVHCRVIDASYFPTIHLGSPVKVEIHRPDAVGLSTKIDRATHQKIGHNAGRNWTHHHFQVYDVDFEKLDKQNKNMAVKCLLATLPPVLEMRQYLHDHPAHELSHWNERLSPASLSLLRWIIASNRACIMQVDAPSDDAIAKHQEKVFGMPHYLQFRFVMGAPDKEQRFVTAVRETAQRLKLQYPSIFAWHGSHLYNWHSIIREGLHFKKITNGRAYGNGVYHGQDANTSLGYSSAHSRSTGPKDPGQWPQSTLQINSVLALNEIVNAPNEFVNKNPYFVIAQLDWIQTRFLFVRCADSDTGRSDQPPKIAHTQDPQATPKGITNQPLIIPAAAIKTNHTLKRSHSSEGANSQDKGKKRKKQTLPIRDAVCDKMETESVFTDEEDIAFLNGEEDIPPASGSNTGIAVGGKSMTSRPSSDFQPGILSFDGLPLLPIPVFATSATTRHLLKELRALQVVQDSTTLTDLGWYVDTAQIENVYQWIVELHSFEHLNPSLPLVKDMKQRSTKSIVMELRFNKDFPFSPPYARIIRPRFLTLAQGGGGHVVMGGAMCMELLTNTGWSSVSSIESVLMQIRMALVSDPPARIDMKNLQDYGSGEAASGYIRACQSHGWTVPPGFNDMASGQSLQVGKLSIRQ